MADQLISADWIAPVLPDDTILQGHCLALNKDRIEDVLPLVDAQTRWPDAKHRHLDQHLLTPGFINTHIHAGMNLFRGMADDTLLMDWLEKHIWPAEARWMSPEFVRDGTALAIAEMQSGGVTCFNDMYFFPNAVAEVSQQMRMRAVVGLIMLDFPTAWAQGPDEYFDKGLQVHDQSKNLSLITTAFAPHAPYTVSDDPLKKILTYADELDIPIHMHLHETRGEIEESINRYGVRPLERLSQLGLVNPRLLAVHMTQLEQAEIDELQKQGAHIAHCVESNLKLASGFAPVSKLLDAGVNVALGTDSVASNNDLDLLAEARTAALVAKAVSGRADSVPASQALEMLTISGARALGLEQETGSLQPGKAADITACDLSGLATQPVYDPVAQLIYSCNREQVKHVWVGGKQVLEDGVLLNTDTDELLAKANEWRDKIAA